MTAITNLEKLLSGDESVKPTTRIEQIVKGIDVKPITHFEQIVCGYDIPPMNRLEQIIKGLDVGGYRSREEYFWGEWASGHGEIEYVGSVPFSVIAKGGAVSEWSLYGAGPYQEWTPSPEKERTANLFDPTTERYEFVAAPNITSYSGAVMFFVPCKKNTTYYILFKTDYESWVRFGTVSKPYVAGEITHYTSDTSSTPSANTKTSVDTHDYEWLFIQAPSASINMSGGLDAVRNSIMVSENPITVFEPYGYREKTGPCEVKGVGERTEYSRKDVKIIGIESNTNYAYFNLSEFPNTKVGETLTITKNNTKYDLAVKKVTADYIYVENRVV